VVGFWSLSQSNWSCSISSLLSRLGNIQLVKGQFPNPLSWG
jgi:hypothetical protein